MSAGTARVIPVAESPDAAGSDSPPPPYDEETGKELAEKDPEKGGEENGSGDEEEEESDIEIADDDPRLDGGDSEKEWEIKPKKMLLKAEMLEYCENTTVHGFTYIPNGRNLCEQIFWVVVVMIGFSCGSVLVHFAFKDWRENPTMTATETYSHPVTLVQYPTITICPIQEYSNWNFPRMLLNRVEFQCKGGAADEKCGAQYTFWKELLASNHSASKQALKTFGYRAKETPMKPFKDHVLFNDLYTEDFYKGDQVNKESVVAELVTPNYIKQEAIDVIDLTGITTGSSDEDWKGKMDNARDYIDACLVGDCPQSSGANEVAFNDCWNKTEERNCKPEWTIELHEMSINVFLVKMLKRYYGAMVEHMYQYTLDANLIGEEPDDKSVNKSVIATAFHHEVNAYFARINQAILGIGPDISMIELPSLLMTVNIRGFKQDEKNEELENRLRSSIYTIGQRYSARKKGGDPFSTLDVDKDSFKTFLKELIDSNELGNIIGKQIDKVMAFMRFAQLLGDPDTNKETWEANFGTETEINSHLEFPIRADYSWETAEERDRLSMLILCESDLAFGAGFNQSRCFEEFKHTVTNIGICSTFNSREFDASLSTKDVYLNKFRDHYNPPTKTKTYTTQGSGQAFTMQLILDSHKKEIYGTKKSTFSVNVNNDYNFFSVGMEGFEAIQGYRTVVSITPIEHIADTPLKDLSVERRKCRYVDENPKGSSSLFKYYTQKACRFECALKNSYKKLQCAPWNYPMVKKAVGETVCDGTNTQYFEGNMTRNDFLSNCKCLPDCKQVAFNQEMDSLLLRPDKECNDPRVLKMAEEDMTENDPADMIFWKFNGLRKNNTFAWQLEYRCLYKVQHDYAMLTMEIATPRIIRTKKQLRFSFVDQLGTLGGGIGLFTGLSLISLVEALFWVGRISWSMANFDPEKARLERREARKEALKEELRKKKEEGSDAEDDADKAEKGGIVNEGMEDDDDGGSNEKADLENGEDEGEEEPGEVEDDAEDAEDGDAAVEDIEHVNHD